MILYNSQQAKYIWIQSLIISIANHLSKTVQYLQS